MVAYKVVEVMLKYNITLKPKLEAEGKDPERESLDPAEIEDLLKFHQFFQPEVAKEDLPSRKRFTTNLGVP